MRISPARVWRYRKFRYSLIGAECQDCGKRFYPPRPVCPFCRSKNIHFVELPKRGRVITYTVIYNPMEGFRTYSPYILAIVELEDGTKVLAPLTDVEPNEVSIGMCVEATVRRIREDGEHGLIAYGTKFRPCIEG